MVISESQESRGGLCGFLNRDIIKEEVGIVEGRTFYICGPQVMYTFCEGELEGLKSPRRKIKREAYGPPYNVTKEPG